ncbi:MAG TPA: ADP-ribosylglycohydrolase [Planctomycetaceae bacterium]|nr:ADP-ribosylglycohydrolase [Planctomycetaceae bacterium]
MGSNREILENLFRTGGIDLVRGPIFDQSPAPLPDDLGFSKVEGMLLGLVIGETLGMTTEGWTPEKRRTTYGEIRDYLPPPHGEEPIALTSDDLQLAFCTVEQMLVDGAFRPERVADHFLHRHIFGRGFTVRRFLANRRSGLPWYQCGPKSSRNGALVRIAAMVIPHLKNPTSELWVDTALSAMITHNDAASTASCLALVHILWSLFGMDEAPDPPWWLERYVSVARQLEGETKYRVRSGKFVDYEGPVWRFVEQRVWEAYGNGLTVLQACSQWHSGAELIETVPSLIYILMCHGAQSEEAVVRAVNDTEDNDTIAAMVGAAMGALYGTGCFPAHWVKNLPQHPTHQEGETVFGLLASVRKMWWE